MHYGKSLGTRLEKYSTYLRRQPLIGSDPLTAIYTYPMLEISKLTVMLSCTAHMLNSKDSGRERRGQGRGALMGTSNVPSNVSILTLSLQGLYVVDRE